MFYFASKFNQPIDNYRWVPKFRRNTQSILLLCTSLKARRTEELPPLARLPNTIACKIATILHGDRIDGFDTSKVVTMAGMFGKASSFNQPVGKWDTSRVVDMTVMFSNATNFNQDIEQWNTGKVKYMQFMFFNEHGIRKKIPTWYEVEYIYDKCRYLYSKENIASVQAKFSGDPIQDKDLYFHNYQLQTPDRDKIISTLLYELRTYGTWLGGYQRLLQNKSLLGLNVCYYINDVRNDHVHLFQ